MPEWTARAVADKVAFGGLGPLWVGSPTTVVDKLESWVEEADIDGFNIAYTTAPGTFDDVVNLLVPELRRRAIYPDLEDRLTARERFHGKGQHHLHDDQIGSTYRYKA